MKLAVQFELRAESRAYQVFTLWSGPGLGHHYDCCWSIFYNALSNQKQYFLIKKEEHTMDVCNFCHLVVCPQKGQVCVIPQT